VVGDAVVAVDTEPQIRLPVVGLMSSGAGGLVGDV
jgi:hypothetical protein